MKNSVAILMATVFFPATCFGSYDVRRETIKHASRKRDVPPQGAPRPSPGRINFGARTLPPSFQVDNFSQLNRMSGKVVRSVRSMFYNTVPYPRQVLRQTTWPYPRQVLRQTTRPYPRQVLRQTTRPYPRQVLRQTTRPPIGPGIQGTKPRNIVQHCYRASDLVFLIDSSGSHGRTNDRYFEWSVDVARRVVNAYKAEGARFGLVFYSCSPLISQLLNQRNSRAKVLTNLGKADRSGGSYDLERGFKSVERVYTRYGGDRLSKKNIVVTFSHGGSSINQTNARINRLRKIGQDFAREKKASLMTVSYENLSILKELNGMHNYFFRESRVMEMESHRNDLAKMLVQRICSFISSN